MPNKSKLKSGHLFFIIGAMCFCVAFGVLIWHFISVNQLAKQSREIANEMLHLLPDRTDGIADGHTETRTPVMQIDGYDYSYLLEFPGCEKSLPVLSRWNESRISLSPSMFYGNISDGSMIIGGSGRKDQFGCLFQIELGDSIILTDMSGIRYTFSVVKIETVKKVYPDFLKQEKPGVTLFAKNEWGFQYIVVRCEAAP